METDDSSPFNLSLDEIIAINKANNREKEIADTEETSNITLDGLDNSTAGNNYGDGFQISKRRMEQRLRSIPGFGSKAIHNRLGYTNDLRKVLNQRKFKQTHVQALVKRARSVMEQKYKVPRRFLSNPVIMMQNQDTFKQPHPALTRTSLNKFNRLTQGFVSKPLGSNRSSFSSNHTQMHQRKIRYSVKDSVNWQTQADIRNFSARHNNDLDFSEHLENHYPPALTANIPTSVRFGRYP